MTQGNIPPGWYDDGQGAQRWWDGNGWTEHTQPAAQSPAQSPAQPADESPAQSPEPAPEAAAETAGPVDLDKGAGGGAPPSGSSADVTMIAPSRGPQLGQPPAQQYGQQYGQPSDQPYGQQSGQPYGQQSGQPYGQGSGQQWGQQAPQQPYGAGQPAYGQGQPQGAYGAPGQVPPWQSPYPTGGSGSGGKGKLIALIGGAVALVLVVGVVLLVVLGGGGGAEGAAKDYLEAQADLDVEKACELTASEPQKQQLDDASAEDCGDLADKSGDFLTDELRGYFDDVEIDIEIDEVSEDGDTADVDYTVTSEYTGDDVDGFKEAFGTEDLEETNTGTLTMVKEDGDWLVSEDG